MNISDRVVELVLMSVGFFMYGFFILLTLKAGSFTNMSLGALVLANTYMLAYWIMNTRCTGGCDHGVE